MTDSRTFRLVWCKDGKCPNDEHHFRGAAREIYSYMKLLAKNNGGFVFATIDDIARHTKNWRKDRKQFSTRQVDRIIRNFKELGILGDYEMRTIEGHIFWGWQMTGHGWWAEIGSGFCNFTFWEEYVSDHQSSRQENVAANVVGNVAANVVGNVVGNVVVQGRHFDVQTTEETKVPVGR